MSEAITFVEIDAPEFDEFGAVTDITTYRFGTASGGMLDDVDYMPLLISARVTNGVMKPGESMGERITLTATFRNDYSGDQGTFWGKFRANNLYTEGYGARRITGSVGDDFASMKREHFLIDGFEGPNSSGRVVLKASDFLKQLNDNKSLAPKPNTGTLSANYPSGTTVVTASPTGIGDSEYPASGRVAIGKEVFDFTRALDVFTLSPAMTEDHKLDESIQQTLEYTSVSSAYIVDDLAVDFSPLDSSYTNLPAWDALLDEYTSALFTREIVKPTPVNKLINELVKQAGLVITADIENQVISFDLLRPNNATGQLIDEDAILNGSYTQKDQPNKRFNEVVVYYDKRSPFLPSDPENYISAASYLIPDSKFLNTSTLRIFSDWIPASSISVAANTAQRIASRYALPPRLITFNTHWDNTRKVGQVVAITDPAIEQGDGSQGTIEVIITGITPEETRNKFTAEQYTIDSNVFAGSPTLQIDADTNNINLRDYYDERFSSVDEDPGAPQIQFFINSGVVVGSDSTALPAIDVGVWPSGVVPRLNILSGSYVVGRGGDGGFGDAGKDGGDAMNITSPISIENLGTIGGGGGGGAGRLEYGGAGGGGIINTLRGAGGAGRNVGVGPPDGTLEDGGSQPSPLTDGGDLGEDGQSSQTSNDFVGFPGGTAGNAIDGVSNIMFIGAPGIILGDQIG